MRRIAGGLLDVNERVLHAEVARVVPRELIELPRLPRLPISHCDGIGCVVCPESACSRRMVIEAARSFRQWGSSEHLRHGELRATGIIRLKRSRAAARVRVLERVRIGRRLLLVD